MNRFERVGLIINAVAGRGYTANAELAARALQALQPRRVHTGAGHLGALTAEIVGCKATIHPAPQQASRRQTMELARQLCTKPLNAILVVGGDGTLSDVALALASIRNPPPLIGIGAGSTNAGMLVTCPGSQIEEFHPDRLQIQPVTGLLAFFNDELLGVGFNDCVIGFTVVATIDGILRDADVGAKLLGKNVPGQPRSIGIAQSRVERSRGDTTELLASGKSVGTVVIGLAERSFIAKAVTGGICLASFTGLRAGCLVADQPLVRVELSPTQALTLPPIHSTFISLSEMERIRVTGVQVGAALCVDGNPLRLLEPGDLMSFEVRPELVRAFKML